MLETRKYRFGWGFAERAMAQRLHSKTANIGHSELLCELKKK
jgi:hypothetical protein